MDIYEALKLIAAKSPNAMREAVRTIRVSDPKILQMRYNWIMDIATSDPQAEFTREEMLQLAELLQPDESADRDYMLRVRLTQTERMSLESKAGAANMNVSEFVRRELGL